MTGAMTVLARRNLMAAEGMGKFILRGTIGGSARVSRAGSGVAPETVLDKFV